MPENFIIKNWNEQQMVFLNNLNEIRTTPKKKSVHDLRVSIKKMRSFLRLSEFISGQSWKDAFTSVKILFRTSGKLRDFDVSLSLLSNYKRIENLTLPSFIKYLELNKSRSSELTIKEALNFNDDQLLALTSIMHLSIATLTDEELISKIKEKVEMLLKKISQLGKNFNKNLHEIRKILKDIYYWLSACPYNPISNIVIEKLDQILQDLGSWQDNFVFLEKLKKVMKEFLEKDTIEVVTAKGLEIKIRKTKKELFNKVKTDIQTYIIQNRST
jgi:CHAD domain-containing protein